MEPRSHATARAEHSARDSASPAGVLGYLALLIGALALLSAPLLAAAVLAVGVAVGVVRRLAGRQRSECAATGDRRTVTRDTVSD